MGVVALQEVMAEQRVLWDPPGERPGDGLDVVDALPRERAGGEDVLVDVRDGERVGVAPLLGRVETLEERPAVTHGEGRGDSRLEDAVATHLTATGVVPRLVEGMGDLADEAPGRAVRKQGVRVDREHIPDRPRKSAGHDPQLVVVTPAGDHGVELVQLAALALPPHPDALTRVPAPAAVEQQEAITGIALVESVHPLDGAASSPSSSSWCSSVWSAQSVTSAV